MVKNKIIKLNDDTIKDYDTNYVKYIITNIDDLITWYNFIKKKK